MSFLPVVISLIPALLFGLFINFLFFKKSKLGIKLLTLFVPTVLIAGFALVYSNWQYNSIEISCQRIVEEKISYLYRQDPNNSEYKNSVGTFHIDDPLFSNFYEICRKEKGSKDENVLQFNAEPYYLQLWSSAHSPAK